MSSGDSFVDAVFESGSNAKIKLLMRWIESQRRADAYGRLVEAAADPDHELRTVAVSRMLHIPPAELRPHADRITELRDACTDPPVRMFLGVLIARIAAC